MPIAYNYIHAAIYCTITYLLCPNNTIQGSPLPIQNLTTIKFYKGGSELHKVHALSIERESRGGLGV